MCLLSLFGLGVVAVVSRRAWLTDGVERSIDAGNVLHRDGGRETKGSVKEIVRISAESVREFARRQQAALGLV
jgi:hypothetical protein